MLYIPGYIFKPGATIKIANNSIFQGYIIQDTKMKVVQEHLNWEMVQNVCSVHVLFSMKGDITFFFVLFNV
jgi:hypothetical protein